MTDINDILAALEQTPESDILAAFLTDELMEVKGMLRTEADRHVQLVRIAATNAKEIAAVARVIKERGHAMVALFAEVRRVIGLDGGESFTAILVNGDHPPRTAVRGGSLNGRARQDEWLVQVPAGWALKWLKGGCWPSTPAAKQRGR